MPRSPLFIFFSLCILIAACKKDDCSCPKPESTYDPDFVVFPVKDVRWIVKQTGYYSSPNQTIYGRIDTLLILEPSQIVSRQLPYNATNYSIYENESAKLYYPIQSKYRNYSVSPQGDTAYSSTQLAVYTLFRVDTTEKKLYELFDGPDAKYEIELYDWDKETGDTIFNYNGIGSARSLIYYIDSIMIGKKYLKIYDIDIFNKVYVMQGGIFAFRHTPPGFWGTLTDPYYKTFFIYKNDTLVL